MSFLDDLAFITQVLAAGTGYCTATYPMQHTGSLICSLKADHDGDHQAKGGPDLVLRTWPRDGA